MCKCVYMYIYIYIYIYIHSQIIRLQEAGWPHKLMGESAGWRFEIHSPELVTYRTLFNIYLFGDKATELFSASCPK